MIAPGQSDLFCRWLLRPYIDLEISSSAPLHAQCIEHGWRALADPQSELFHPQRAMAPGFRTHLAREAGGPCSISDPREIPVSLRTDRWNALCAMIDEWESLPANSKLRLASLLHSMGFYALIVALRGDTAVSLDRAEPDEIELAFWQASAAYVANVPRRISDYHAADLSAFEAIALANHDATRCRFNATVKVFVHKAKTKASKSELCTWAARLEQSFERAVVRMDDFNAALHTSRFHRAMGFLPQVDSDGAGVARVMDFAEDYAGEVKQDTPAHTMLARENWHALMESRTKEALAFGDIDLALERALKVIAVDPFDAKAWVELGHVHQRKKSWREAAEAYATAATLGPPASAVGRHLAGICLREMGFDALAASFFKETSEYDPLGISPRQAIDNLPSAAVFDALKEWTINVPSKA